MNFWETGRGFDAMTAVAHNLDRIATALEEINKRNAATRAEKIQMIWDKLPDYKPEDPADTTHEGCKMFDSFPVYDIEDLERNFLCGSDLDVTLEWIHKVYGR